MNQQPALTSGDGTDAPAFQVLDADDIEIVSLATGRCVTLADAMREGWVVCAHCGSPYDPADIELLREDDPKAPCISDVCRHRQSAPLNTAPLPVERIVVFARARMHEAFREGVLYRLFYEHDDARTHPHFALRGAEGPATPVQPEPAIREENWLNRGLVLTKRRRGRFVSWVPIGLPSELPAPGPGA